MEYNTIEQNKLIEKELIELKNKYNLYAVKTDLEAETISIDSIKQLKYLAEKLELKFAMKIGGCGSIKDLLLCKSVGVDIIIAPMIETSYALKKFIASCKEVYSEAMLPMLNINIETITGVNDFDNIVAEYEKDISGIVFGRSDFTSSINENNVDSNVVCNYIRKIKDKAQKLNKSFTLGGNLTVASLPFIECLNPTYVGTRNLVFYPPLTAEAVRHYIEFEILWLMNKTPQSVLDIKRLKALKSRL